MLRTTILHKYKQQTYDNVLSYKHFSIITYLKHRFKKYWLSRKICFVLRYMEFYEYQKP